MIINREGYLISKTERECTKCNVIFKKTSNTVTLCNTCNSERVKCTSPEKKMLARAKTRARVKNIEFTLCLDDIKIPKTCPILGLPLVCKKGSGGDSSSPALDRIDPKKGYTKENTRVISNLANMMKSHANETELLLFANWIIKNIPAKTNDLS